MLFQEKPEKDLKWLIAKIIDEGFGVILKPSRDGVSSFLTVSTKDGFLSKQVTRLKLS